MAILIDIERVFAQFDVHDFDAEKSEHGSEQQSQRVAAPGASFVEGTDIVAQCLPIARIGRLIIFADQKAAGEIAMNALQAERALPVFRCARASVAEKFRPRRHALFECFRKRGQCGRIKP